VPTAFSRRQQIEERNAAEGGFLGLRLGVFCAARPWGHRLITLWIKRGESMKVNIHTIEFMSASADMEV